MARIDLHNFFKFYDEKNPNQNLFEVKHLGQGAGA